MDIYHSILGIVVILGGALASVVIYALYHRGIQRAERTASKLDDLFLISLGKPLIVFVLAAAVWYAFTYEITLPGEQAWVVGTTTASAFLVFLGTWAAASFVEFAFREYGREIAEKTDTDLDDHILGTLEKTAHYIIWFIGILMVLCTLNVDITPLVAGAGVAGIAVALAAQEIIGNIFAGSVIMVDQPLRVNDRVRILDHFGDVVRVGPRSTQIKTIDDLIITIPNTVVTQSVITNYARPEPKIVVNIQVPVAYGSDVEQVMSILNRVVEEAAAEEDYILTDPKPVVFFDEFGASSLNFMLRVWTNDFRMERTTRSTINREIDRRFREEGIEIPFSQIDIHIRDDGNGLSPGKTTP
ncbi:mechanosensitive ion channel family protein [Methanofollis aquaemaris]|uniref:Mechanosensitive ion channel family protein n=1 Tax=Methanofollis aquaemaris TaxID=126734 RepID=A0A8A3S7U7_9EURY|nr:mechanosensitive ion channel family protein [Methanofollis aquaemaris]QSZ67801.1 mechanosensitive ion channel family protein [Methanofollis aquaemaris]